MKFKSLLIKSLFVFGALAVVAVNFSQSQSSGPVLFSGTPYYNGKQYLASSAKEQLIAQQLNSNKVTLYNTFATYLTNTFYGGNATAFNASNDYIVLNVFKNGATPSAPWASYPSYPPPSYPYLSQPKYAPISGLSLMSGIGSGLYFNYNTSTSLYRPPNHIFAATQPGYATYASYAANFVYGGAPYVTYPIQAAHIGGTYWPFSMQAAFISLVEANRAILTCRKINPASTAVSNILTRFITGAATTQLMDARLPASTSNPSAQAFITSVTGQPGYPVIKHRYFHNLRCQ